MFAQNPAASESTKVEAERAKAEVVAKVMAARQMPRHEARARQRILEMCQEPRWASETNVALFKFSRGGQSVSGMTIHVATEMARIWGNIEFGVLELARGEGQSEMRAFAWDLETNTCPVSNFIVPHTRDTKSGKRPLVDDRDIYENNANQGARRMREMIFRLIPKHLRDEAEETLRRTLAKGDGTPLAQRRRQMADAFQAIGVTPEMIEAAKGRAVNDLTEADLGDLRTTFQSIKGGELTVEQAFGAAPKATGPLAAAEKEKAGKAGQADDPPKNEHADDWTVTGTQIDYLANWKDRLRKATAREHVNAMKGVNAERIAKFPGELQDRIYAAADARIEELEGNSDGG